MSPPLGFDSDEAAWAAVVDVVNAARPDLVYVALGFARQEHVSLRLSAQLPGA